MGQSHSAVRRGDAEVTCGPVSFGGFISPVNRCIVFDYGILVCSMVCPRRPGQRQVIREKMFILRDQGFIGFHTCECLQDSLDDRLEEILEFNEVLIHSKIKHRNTKRRGTCRGAQSAARFSVLDCPPVCVCGQAATWPT